KIERGSSMTKLSKNLGLNMYVQIRDISCNDYILEDIFEAFIGAFYINFGMEYARILIINIIERHINLSDFIAHEDNYKDLLLRYFHQMKWGHPVYDEINVNKNKKYNVIVKTPTNKILGKGSA